MNAAYLIKINCLLIRQIYMTTVRLPNLIFHRNSYLDEPMAMLRLLFCICFILIGAVETLAMSSVAAASGTSAAHAETSSFWVDVKDGHYPIPCSPSREETRVVPMQSSWAVSAGHVIRTKTDRGYCWPFRFSLQTDLPRTFRSARIHYLRNLVVLIISNQAP